MIAPPQVRIRTKWPLFLLAIAAVAIAIFVILSKGQPRVIWVRDFPADSVLSPAIGADGTIYFVDETINLCAVTRDGSVLWKTLIMKTSPTAFTAATGISINSSGVVYVVWGTGNLVAFGPHGRLRWSRDLGVFEFAGIAIGPDNTLYVGSKSNSFYAITPDGSIKWQFTTAGEKIGGPVVGGEGTIYFGCSERNLYALNPDGTLKWVCTNRAHHISRPIVGPDETIYVDCWPQLSAINPDGSVKWSAATAGGYSPILDSSGTLYLYEKGVVAVEASTGKVKWRYFTETVIPYAGLAVAHDGTVYFASFQDGIEALDRNGKRKWTFSRSAFGRKDAPPLWARILFHIQRFPKPSGNATPMAFTLAEDNRLYAIMPDAKLYALKVSAGLDTNAPWPMSKHDVRHSGRVRSEAAGRN